MTLRQFDNILAFQSPEGRVLGFHRDNLELAELSDELWRSLTSTSTNTEALSELQEWNDYQSPEVKSGELGFGIRSLTINVTQICNLHCTYCAAGGDGSYGDPQTRISVEKTFPQLKKFLADTPEGETFTIHFLGGEPLLYPKGIEALANYARLQVAGRKIQLQFAITTNGTLLTESNVDLLARLNSHISISIDGPARITDRMRPSKNKKSTTGMILEGLRYLSQRRSELGSLGLHAVFDAHNIELVEAYRFFQQLDVDYYEFTFSHTEKSEEANSQYMQQMEKLFAEAYAYGGEAELRKIRSVNHYMDQLENQQRVMNFCGAGKSFLMIDSRNDLYTCPWLVGEKSELVGQSDQLDAKALTAYQKPQMQSTSCQSCWAKYLCGGGCSYEHQVKTGTKHEKSMQFCQRMRHFILLILIYFDKSRTAQA